MTVCVSGFLLIRAKNIWASVNYEKKHNSSPSPLLSIVIRPDRRTRDYNDSVYFNDRPCNRTGKNRTNPIFCQTGEPAGFHSNGPGQKKKNGGVRAPATVDRADPT